MANKLEDELNKILEDGALSTNEEETKILINKLINAAKVQETITKIENENAKVTLLKEEFEFKKELAAKQEEAKQEEVAYQHTLDTAKFELEKTKLAIATKELELKEQSNSITAKADRNKMIVTCITCAVPAVIGLVTSIIGIRTYNKLAIRALTMEYIDNSISPRSFNECMNSVKNYIKK